MALLGSPWAPLGETLAGVNVWDREVVPLLLESDALGLEGGLGVFW